jgi:hypothetical protein
MGINYFYQVVYCNERPGRAFRLEYAVSPHSVVVVGCEALPPVYEMVLEQMSRAGDLQYAIRTDEIEFRPGTRGCPFCGNLLIFFCNCGAVCCRSSDKGNREQYCPRCGVIHPSVVFEGTAAIISASGITEGRSPYRDFAQIDEERRRPRRSGYILDRTGYVPARIEFTARRPGPMRMLWNWLMQPMSGRRR